MHDFAVQDRQVLRELVDWIVERRAVPLGGMPSRTTALPPLTRSGIGIRSTWTALRDQLLPTSFPTDHPRYLAFVGGSSTPAAVISAATDAAVTVASGGGPWPCPPP